MKITAVTLFVPLVGYAEVAENLLIHINILNFSMKISALLKIVWFGIGLDQSSALDLQSRVLTFPAQLLDKYQGNLKG